ncbi:MAG: protein kinase family protein [Propionibacteriales bacterium]|nr:protein kinase family protein [Propionibacteriales bacterium]
MATSTRSGDVLAGRYRLIDLLSESGGGRFWRARDAVLERFVALHVISDADPRAAGLVEAARTSASVLDPRILRVLDAEQEDGRCFVVNEWGTGISLDILVTNAGPLGPRRAAWLVSDVAAAIARAHAAGVTHGRLNPENILIDRYGSIRIIGMCVDAALHGLPPGDVDGDLQDLGGLLYCALTGTWPGPSGSIVPAAPRENDAFLSPRQVRAGVPKPLDLLWREFDCTQDHGRRRLIGSDHPDVSTAQGIAAELLSFVGDPTGMPGALAQSIPPINELRPVWLPAVEDPLPHDSSRDDIPVVAAEPVPVWADERTLEREEPDDATDATDGDEDPPIPLVSELPTEAGIPLFGGDDEDVQWLRTRSTPPPPPPPFEDPPERPLFATDPADGSAVRRPRPDAVSLTGPHPGDPGEDGVRPHGYWPWDTGGVNAPDAEDTSEDEAVPGRNWLRLAMAVGLAVLLLVAVAIAFNLGRGRTALGGDPDPEPTESATSTKAAQAPVISGITPTDFDPLGENGENPDGLPNLFDGDNATVWSTQTYDDQLGSPLGLKTGVGLVLDLGRKRDVRTVDLRIPNGTAKVQLFSFDTVPIAAPSGKPVASATGSGRLTLTPRDEGATAATPDGRYLVLWLTALPEVPGGFRAEISEVVVRGE